MVKPSSTAPRSRSPEQIRGDIERTRADMDQTMNALEDRLSPGRLADELWTRMRARGPEGRGFLDMVADHPVPLALMGFGLGWLAIEESTGRSLSSRPKGSEPVGAGTTGPAEGRRGPYGPDAIDHSDPRWVHGSRESGVGERAKSAAHRLGEVAESAKEKVTDALSSSKEMASGALSASREAVSGTTGAVKERWEGASEEGASGAGGPGEGGSGEGGRRAEQLLGGARRAANEGRGRVRRAGEGVSGFIEQNPLAAGIVAFAFGMAGGLSAPPSEAESRVLGPSSRAVKDETKRAVREAGESAREMVEGAADAAQQGLARSRDEGGEALAP